MAEYNLGKVVGDNAYELWLAGGNIGTLEDFLQACKGDAFTYDDFTEEQLAGLKGDTVIASELQMKTGYDGTTDMQSGVSYAYEADATEVLFSLAVVADGSVGIYSLTIAVGDDVPTFSYPSSLVWSNGELALMANTTYELNILNGVVTYIYYSNE